MTSFLVGLASGVLFGGIGSTPTSTSISRVTEDLTQDIQQSEYAACEGVQTVSIPGQSISIGKVDCKGDINIGNVTVTQDVKCHLSQRAAAVSKASMDAKASASAKASGKGNSYAEADTEADLQQYEAQRMQAQCGANQNTRLANQNINIQSITSQEGGCKIASTNATQQFNCYIDQTEKASNNGTIKMEAKSTAKTSGWTFGMLAGVVIIVIIVFIVVSRGFSRGKAAPGLSPEDNLSSGAALSNMRLLYQKISDSAYKTATTKYGNPSGSSPPPPDTSAPSGETVSTSTSATTTTATPASVGTTPTTATKSNVTPASAPAPAPVPASSA